MNDLPIHKKTPVIHSFDRLKNLWERYPQYHEMTTFSTMEQLLEEHESWKEDFEAYREEYIQNDYDRFLIQLSWSDLPYRYATKNRIQEAGALAPNSYVESFLAQFADIDHDHEACFLFPESYLSQFFVIMEVCKNAKTLRSVRSLFPDENKLHYLAIFDKQQMEDVLLMFHLLYTNTSEDLYGGYSLYDYSLPWYQYHLWEDKIPFRSPYLPDQLAKYQGNLPWYHNPAKTVSVRRNIQHILESGYFSTELVFFRNLTEIIMPMFQWWYRDIALYEEKDGYKTNWRLRRTQIRTKLTAEGVIRPKWKHELTLFQLIRERYADTLYQYRPEWLGRQSLDLFIPSLQTAIEYQGIQHYRPVDFFGGEEALALRQELDRQKQKLCEENNVQLIHWPYDVEPTANNLRKLLGKE